MPNGGHAPCCENCIHYQKHEFDIRKKCTLREFYMPCMGLLNVLCRDWRKSYKVDAGFVINLLKIVFGSIWFLLYFLWLKRGVLYYEHHHLRGYAPLGEFKDIKNPTTEVIIKFDKVFKWSCLLMKGTIEYFPKEGSTVIVELDGSEYEFTLNRRLTFDCVRPEINNQMFSATRWCYLYSEEHPYIFYDWINKHYKVKIMDKDFENHPFMYALFEVVEKNKRYRFRPVAHNSWK
jgi:hypothetical protein